MSETTEPVVPSPPPPTVTPAVSKRIVALLSTLIVLQCRRFGVSEETLSLLLDAADLLLGLGVASHWSAPLVRKALWKAKKEVGG